MAKIFMEFFELYEEKDGAQLIDNPCFTKKSSPYFQMLT